MITPGQTFEFKYGFGGHSVTDKLISIEDDYGISGEAQQLLEKAEPGEGKAKAIVTTPERLGFKKDFITNRAVMKAGLALGYNLLAAEAVIHLREIIVEQPDDSVEEIIVATKGYFLDDEGFMVDDTDLLTPTLDWEEAGGMSYPIISTAVLSYRTGEERMLRDRSSHIRQMWIFGTR